MCEHRAALPLRVRAEDGRARRLDAPHAVAERVERVDGARAQRERRLVHLDDRQLGVGEREQQHVARRAGQPHDGEVLDAPEELGTERRHEPRLADALELLARRRRRRRRHHVQRAPRAPSSAQSRGCARRRASAEP